jgi:predicted nucleic acid-binding protein
VILVDSSVWIDYFNGAVTGQTDLLDSLLGLQPVLVGDLILAEVLQGFKDDQDFEKAHQALSSFPQASLLNIDLAVKSARNYRNLRKMGVTVRKTVDCLIATFCIEAGHDLLHADRDFEPFVEYLGLRVVKANGEA